MKNEILKAQSYKCRFLEAGISTFEDGKTLLIKSEDLMRFAEKFKGFPIIIDHVDLDSGNVHQQRMGVITSIWRGEDGWAWCEMLIDNAEAMDKLNEGWLVSCMYYITSEGPNGLYHDIPYDVLVLDIEPNHIAIVEDPRYEDVIVIKNSKSKNNSMFKIFSRNKKDEAIKNAMEEVENAVYMDGEKEVPLSELVENFKKVKAAANKRIMNADDEVEIEGSAHKISEMIDAVNSYKAMNESKEAQEDKQLKEAKEETKEASEYAANAKNSKKAKAEKKEEPKEEAAAEDDLEGFKKIKNNLTEFRKDASAEAAKVSEKKFTSESEKLARGAARYGSRQTASKA